MLQGEPDVLIKGTVPSMVTISNEFQTPLELSHGIINSFAIIVF